MKKTIPLPVIADAFEKKDAGGDKKSFISALLDQRRLPALPGTREEMLRTLAEMEYGPVPPAPRRLTAEKLSETSRCAGHAVEETYRLSAGMDGFTASFPIRFVYPVSAPGKGLPLFVFINFSREAPDWYYPANEIADAGFAVASLCYLDVTDDADDGYSTGIAPDMVRVYGPTGKISLWAWACMRALDWALERGGIDPDRVAVIGHSRLGKTALWAGANDERFTHVFSNDSGCSGAALSRGNTGETIEAITRRFPHWSADAYKAFAGKEDEAPFDQHWLLAAVAPRKLYAASASKDDWADPRGEYLSCCAASAAWERLGLKGFSHPDRLPEVGEVLREGCVGYHLREGAHYLDRWDWQRYMEFMLINQE